LNKKFILWFNEIGVKDVPSVGGKNASLGEMYSNLTKKGINVPNGFAVTAYAYDYLLEKSGLRKEIKSILKGLNTKDMDNLSLRGKKIRTLIRNAYFPEELRQEILSSYRKLSKQYRNSHIDVAVRSSATAEDLPDASFAGQQETYLNIVGERALIDACRKCFASLFTDRAISYREDKKFNHFDVSLSIAVQKMVRADKASSGVMFSIDTETGFENAVLITGAYGLGETIVQGKVNPDEFYVFKPTLKKGFKPILKKNLGSKKIKMIYDSTGNKETKTIKVDRKERKQFILSDNEILKLAEWACVIEDHYSKKKKKLTPMDIEWAKDGVNGKLFIVQARPETVHSQKDFAVLEKFKLKEKGKILAKGKSVGERIGHGKANVIMDVKDIRDFKKGEILVTEMTDPDWEPILKIANGVVTNKGGRTCHSAIISRELGIPCIVGTDNGTKKISDGKEITIDCSSGEEGLIYEGLLKFEVEKHELGKLPKTKTKIMLNLAAPEQAFEKSFLPSKGIGLARMEFVINNHIQVHPNALIYFNKVKDAKIRKKINELTQGYKDKKEFFIDKLAQGISMLAAAFYPNEVILRFSDFKTNEYANLLGGKYFEPEESNPMIGWRGASRYYDEKFKKAFALECKAVKKIREEMGLTNLTVMVPFCRTVKEGKKVLNEMKENNLPQGKHGLKVYAMCEIPSNAILAEEFLEVFDGFSIGSNDLTQLILGLDRDSELVSSVYDEENQAVKDMVKKVISAAKKKKKYIGFCGQAPSDKPSFAKFLIECGIDSISLNPDTVIKTTLDIAKYEKKVK
jgi:pyruvate,water dikinase